MRRISSRMTFFNKRVFPVLWFGFLILFIAGPFVSSVVWNTAPPPPPFFIVPAIMIGAGYFVMKRLIFVLVDEVWEDDDSLLIKNRGEEERVAFSDIKNVSYSPFVNPPRVTLSLRRSSVFGNDITFNAPIRFVPFSRSPIIQDLIDRVDRARGKN
jgi:hypothetical protein